MKTKIFFDMDNTIVEMTKGVNPKTNSGICRSYDCEVSNKYLMQRLNEKGFFENLKPIYRATETVRTLAKDKDFEIYILTQPMPNTYSTEEKYKWILKHLPEIPIQNIIPTFHKYLLAGEGRILIDDSMKHLEKWEKEGGRAICFVRGYNKNWKGEKIQAPWSAKKILEMVK